MKAENGTSSEEVAKAASLVFVKLAHPELNIGWDDFSEMARENWLTVGAAGIELCQKAKGARYDDIARELAGNKFWDTMPLSIKIAWEAVARFIASVVEADEWDNVIDVEFWKNWHAAKLKEKECLNPQPQPA